LWVEATGADTTGWLAAIRDPKIGRALAAIHQRPGHKWSVESLAGVARTSRSIFSERFAVVVGVPPAGTSRAGACTSQASGCERNGQRLRKWLRGWGMTRKRRSAEPSSDSWANRPVRFAGRVTRSAFAGTDIGRRIAPSIDEPDRAIRK
jgi:hypothetical protein